MRALVVTLAVSLLLVPITAATPLARAASHTAVRPLPPPALVAQAAFILDDTTGRALYAYHADVERDPASTLKMLTAIVALQHLRLRRVVTVPYDAMVGGTTARLSPGEQMTAGNLFYGMLLPSGNDAAVTLADAVSGSSAQFAVLMNAEARRLHLWHTHALGPDGFDLYGQYTTARDLAWLAHALLRRPTLARIVRTQTWQASSVDGRYAHYWTNLNQLLGSYPGSCGVKTGTTPLAGANLVACDQRGGQRLIAVLMGSTVASRFSDGAALLNYGWSLLRGSARR